MASSTTTQYAGCCGLAGRASKGPSEDSMQRGIMEAEGTDKATSWLKKTFKSANNGELQGTQSSKLGTWYTGARASFKSFRSEFDIRSHAETVVQALSTRRVYLLRYVRAAVFVLNVRTLFMCALACAIVYLCESDHLDLRFRLDFSIISVGTIFPLVFAIQQAFTRRDEALKEMAFLKAQLMGIYFCNRDWDISDGLLVRSNLGNDAAEHAVRCQQLIIKFLTTLKQWLVSRTVYESESERRSLEARGWLPAFVHGSGHDLQLDAKRSASFTQRVTDSERADTQKQMYYQCYHYLSQLNVLNETLTAKANYPKAGEGGMSRLAQYIAKSTEALEKLRYLREYRTPFMLRHVSFILILVSIFLMSPYFAFMCFDSKWEQDRTGSCPAGYVMAVLYVVVVCTLYGVQVALENPFDGEGMDDVYFDLPREFEETMQRYGRAGNFHKASAGTIVGNSVYVVGASGIPPTGYSNYPGGLAGTGSGGGVGQQQQQPYGIQLSVQQPSSRVGGAAGAVASAGGDCSHVITVRYSGGTGSGGGAMHAAAGYQALALPPTQQALPLRGSADPPRPQHTAAHMVEPGKAAISTPPMGLAAASAATALGGIRTNAGAAPRAVNTVVNTKGHMTTSSSKLGSSCTDTSSLSGTGGGGDAGTPSPDVAALPTAPKANPPFSSTQQQQQQQRSPPQMPLPTISIKPNGNPGPGFFAAAAPAARTAAPTALPAALMPAASDAAGVTALPVDATAPNCDSPARDPSPFSEPSFQTTLLTAAKLPGVMSYEQLQLQQQQRQHWQQQQQQRLMQDGTGFQRKTAPPEHHQPDATAGPTRMARQSGGGSRGGAAAGGPFQRPSLGVAAASAIADSSAQSTPRGPFQRPSLGVPVGAAAVGLMDSHPLLVAGGSGPGTAMRHLQGGSPATSSALGSGAGRGSGGQYRMQQRSARAIGIGSNAGRPQLLAGGSPASTVPGTPLMPGSHGTSLTGMHGGVGVSSRTSLGGAVLLAMDQESGAVGTVLVPDMPRGDADSPTAQDAIEADLARGMFGHLHVASVPLGLSSSSHQPSASLLLGGVCTPTGQQSPPLY